MRNIQEQHEAEIKSIQQEHLRRAKTPQPYYPVGKEGYMVGRRAYTPQPTKSQFPTPKPNDGHLQVQPPRRRQLFADNDEIQKPTRIAKVFAEAMMNDMVCQRREKLNHQEQIEMEPLPFCTLDGIPDSEVTPTMKKLKQSGIFYIPKPTTPQPNIMNHNVVDPKMYAISRTLSTSVPSKNDSVLVVPLYEKIDTPEHDILQSSRIIPVSEGQHNVPERIYQRTPSPFGVKPSSSESLYSKATKPGDPLYGKITKKADQSSPVRLEQMHNYKYVCQTPKTDQFHSANMADVPFKSRHYIKSPDGHVEFSPQRPKYALKESPRGKQSIYYESPQQDMLDLSVTPESLPSDFSPEDDKQERGNISGTSTEFSPPGNNPNRSNASGTSVDQSPSAFQEVRKLCDTPIAHPKMLPRTPSGSPTSPNNDSMLPHHGQSVRYCRKPLGSSIVYAPEEHINYNNLSGSKVDFSRNVTGESVNFSPIQPHSQYLSPSRVYSPSRHIVETDKSTSSSSSPLKSTRENTSGASAKMSPCRILSHPPEAEMLTPKMTSVVKEVLMNSKTASEPPKRNAKTQQKRGVHQFNTKSICFSLTSPKYWR